MQQIDRVRVASALSNQLSPTEQAQILHHLTEQTKNSAKKVSKLDQFSEFLQTEGCYEDDYIQQSMVIKALTDLLCDPNLDNVDRSHVAEALGKIEPLNSSSQQQWQQAIDTIRHQTPIDLGKQKARISDMFAQFNQDEDEVDQQEALKIISDLTKTSI